MTTRIYTISELLTAIRDAREVLVQTRFGVSETWVKLSKTDARILAKSLPRNATPASAEMYTGTFGSVDHGTLFLG